MESGDGVFEGERGVSALLCALAGIAASGDGKSALCQRVWGNFARGFGRCAVSVEFASRGVYELDERSVSQRRAGSFSSTGV